MCVFRSARALSRHGPWTATSTFAPIEWSVIVPGAGCRAHEEAEGGSAPSNHVARWYNHLARLCVSSSCCGNMLSGTSFFLRHVIILVVSGPSKADRRETRATARLSMIIVRAQKDFYSHHSAKLAPGVPYETLSRKARCRAPQSSKEPHARWASSSRALLGALGCGERGARSMSPSPPALAKLFPATAHLWGGPREVLPHVEGHTALAQ